MGLFIVVFLEMYKEWVKVGERDLKSDSLDIIRE